MESKKKRVGFGAVGGQLGVLGLNGRVVVRWEGVLAYRSEMW